MEVEMIRNELERMYASPEHHPITCVNPAPWLIQEMKITIYPLKVWIRNEGSMWFRADQCSIGTKEDLETEKEMTKNKKETEDDTR